ncbi:MAG TPA: Uma2 family endonuclease, partial [Humisphaera sp.]|nr:Uma2 family endonuclease [Humisphaera sp.]
SVGSALADAVLLSGVPENASAKADPTGWAFRRGRFSFRLENLCLTATIHGMTTLAQPIQYTPDDVERASHHDGKRYELIDGQLKEKNVGTRVLFVASRICDRLNAAFYPRFGFAAVEAMIYCFDRPNHGRKPDVVFISFGRLGSTTIPQGDIHVAPELVVEVLSPGNAGIEVEEKLNAYLDAGIQLVWIVNPDRRTIRAYRKDGTTRLYRENDALENEPLLPGLRLVAREVFPVEPTPNS